VQIRNVNELYVNQNEWKNSMYSSTGTLSDSRSVVSTQPIRNHLVLFPYSKIVVLYAMQ
jgi:hypothetical protein